MKHFDRLNQVRPSGDKRGLLFQFMTEIFVDVTRMNHGRVKTPDVQMFMIRCCLTRLLIFPPSQPGDEGTLLASVILCVTLWNSSLSPLTHRLKCSSFVPVRSLMSYLTTMIKSWEYCSVSPRCVLMSAAGDKLIYSDVSRRSAAHLTLALHCSVLQHSLQCTSCGLILQARKIARHTFLCCETWGFCKQSLNATIKLNLVL